MSILVNPHNEHEEKVLLAFLNSLQYDYQTNKNDFILSEEKKAEILRRDKAFEEGETTARPWKEIRDQLKSVYR